MKIIAHINYFVNRNIFKLQEIRSTFTNAVDFKRDAIPSLRKI